MILSIIVAVAENNAIGKNNELLCHVPGDLKRFRQITLGNPVIMGRRTWYSLPKRPLPGRLNIVITDQPDDVFEGAEKAFSIKEALGKCGQAGEIFVIGGASVYQQFLPLCSRLYLTLIHKSFDADAFFPEIDYAEWDIQSREDHSAGETNNFAFSYLVLNRKK
jgi:dihydrofolate reductase